MTTLRAAAQQALEAWDNDENGTLDHPLSSSMETLRAALDHWTEYERSIAATEREACAKVVWATPEPDDEYIPLRRAIADAIRARGQA